MSELPGGDYPVYPSSEVAAATDQLSAAIDINRSAIGNILMKGYSDTNTLINGNTLAIQSLISKANQSVNSKLTRVNNKATGIASTGMLSVADQVQQNRSNIATIPGVQAQIASQTQSSCQWYYYLDPSGNCAFPCVAPGGFPPAGSTGPFTTEQEAIDAFAQAHPGIPCRQASPPPVNPIGPPLPNPPPPTNQGCYWVLMPSTQVGG